MKEAIRKYILEKAKQILSKKGFKNTTMDEIAEVSDISKPTLYKYFSSKEDLFVQVLIEINSEVDKTVLGIINIEDDIFNNIITIITKTMEFLIKHKAIMKMALFESREFIKQTKDRNSHINNFIKNRQRRKKFLEKLLIKGQKEGKVRDDLSPEILSIMFLGIMKEISFETIFLDFKTGNIKELSVNIADIIIDGIKKRR
jgi:AcrR family transcriptional regulator